MSLNLTDQPREIIKGLHAWRNRNGYVAALLHFSSDPLSASEEERRRTSPDESSFQQEHNLDFSTWAGKSVYPGFDDKKHVDASIGYHPDYPVWVGMDFGYHRPAAVFAQVGPEFWVLGEVMGENMTLEQFLTHVFHPYKNKLFPADAKMLYAADPAGRQISDKSEHTSFAILSNHGIYPLQRKTEINEGLTLLRQRLHIDLLKVHPRCRLLIEGFRGGYRYPDPTPGRPEPMLPLKDGFYDHPMDALRYLAVNAMSLITPRPKTEEPEKTLLQKNTDRLNARTYTDDLDLLNA